MAEMAIGEAARRAGVEPSTLRYYESIGILPAPKRVSGQRRYTSDVLLRMAFIGVAKEAGFTMREVRTLLHGFAEDTAPSERWKALARSKLAEVEALIARAHAMKRLLEEGLECECLRLEECELFIDRTGGEAA